MAKECRTVFLDAGGVLVWPNWNRIAKELESQGVVVAPERLAAADPMVRRALDDAALIGASADQQRGSTYFDRVLREAGVPASDAADAAMAVLHEYHGRRNLWEYVPPFVPPTLRSLRARGLQLVVVSNANGTVAAAFERLGLAPLVDAIIDSSDFGVEKPNPRLFDIALERCGADRRTTIHVGDFYHIDVVGARAAGLVAVLVDQAGLYESADCRRIRSIAELPDVLR